MWSALLLVVVGCVGRGSMQSASKKFIYSNNYQYDMIYNVTVDSDTDQILDFKELNDTWLEYPSRVHVLAPPDVTEEHPLFVTATQQSGVSSWELPLVVRQNYHKPTVFREMARTLCPSGLRRREQHPQEKYTEGRPRIQLSTWSPQPLTASIKLRRVRDFYLRTDRETPAKAAPGAPALYYYDFKAPPNASDVWNAEGGTPYSVLLYFESDDELCAIVSVQDIKCPVLDDESEVQYRGLRLTAMRRAAITVPGWMFAEGFFVVVIVKENDDACRLPLLSSPAQPPRSVDSLRDRVKHFRLSIRPTLPYRQYVVVGLLTAGLLFAFYGAVELVALCRWPRFASDQAAEPLHGVDGVVDNDDTQESSATARAEDATSLSSSVVSPDEVHFQTISVAALCKTPYAVRARRSRLYLWQALTVAVVYALPVLQLLASYQKAALSAGDLDLCYYNALCAHPLEAALADFNHVYSNIGYVLLGLLFIVQVRRRAAADGVEEASLCGVPQHHGLMYSLGVALVTEGVLSAAYHLCPNQMNFQFDSSFMYVTAALCVLTLYHGRQPDVAARAHAAFLALAALFAIGVLGTLAPNDAFWGLLTTLHVLTCAALSLHLYYFGGVGAGVMRLVRLMRAEGVRVARPRRAVRLALLALANVANWALAACGWVYHRHELAKHLMLVLVANTAMYTALYLCCKLAQRERVCARATAYGLGALLLWAIAFYCFSQSTTKWALTPAASRELNAECSWLGFYDTHDAWHITSAGAMFLSFNLLLSVDDAQRRQPRHALPVF